MNWNKSEDKPCHKDLVLAKMSDGAIVPAIYYDNSSFVGFYPYTTYYENHRTDHYYSKVITAINDKFEDVVEWVEITSLLTGQKSVVMQQSDVDHLRWIYGRMRFNGEPDNLDYMVRFKKIIDDNDKNVNAESVGFHYRFMVIANDYKQ